jgi:hypothetical protein
MSGVKLHRESGNLGSSIGRALNQQSKDMWFEFQSRQFDLHQSCVGVAFSVATCDGGYQLFQAVY